MRLWDLIERQYTDERESEKTEISKIESYSLRRPICSVRGPVVSMNKVT